MSRRANSTAPGGVRNNDVNDSASGTRPRGAMAGCDGERGRRDHTSAQLRITIKPAGGTDAAGLLQADIDQFTGSASAILADVNRLTPPETKALRGPTFQQEASVNYTATVLNPQGAIPVIGTFTELLNTSNGRSAFVDFRQDSSATTQAAGDGGMMIGSMK